MDTQAPTTKNNKSTRILIAIIIALIAILGWAGLTKAGYIPNFLGLDILCSSNDYPEETNTTPKRDTTIDPMNAVGLKPVIYLYPTQEETVRVELNLQGKLIADYPEYNESINGWEVTAYPNGQLQNHADNKEYSYIFWEGIFDKQISTDPTKGFVVKGEDTREFLQKTLPEIGLNSKEYNEFIVYWYPRMKNNQYNLIQFAGEEYTSVAPLTITPRPDSMLRVFMTFKPLDNEITVEPQQFEPFERTGFTVIEWGGTELK